jgi:hypothetical protein
MTLRRRLDAVEKTAAARATLAAAPARGVFVDMEERIQIIMRQRSAWEDAFIAGENPPLPSSRPYEVGTQDVESPLLRDWYEEAACVRARMDGRIGPTDYIPAMGVRAREWADGVCGTAWEAVQLEVGRERPFPWPEWQKFGGRFCPGLLTDEARAIAAGIW